MNAYTPMTGTSMAPYSFGGFSSVPKTVETPDGGSYEIQVMPDAFYKSQGTTEEAFATKMKQLALASLKNQG